MSKLSRFLYGAWLYNSESAVNAVGSAVQVSGAYKDWRRASHTRSVSYSSMGFTVVDDVAGKYNKATLRWRLVVANWTLGESMNSSDFATLRWESNQDLQTRVSDAVESRFYYRLDP